MSYTPALKKIQAYDLCFWMSYLVVRFKVYIGEYQRKITEEFNIADIKANHYIFAQEKQVIGIARVIYKDGIAELGRITIAKEYRNQGYGKELMKELLKVVSNSKKAKIVRLFLADEALAGFYHQFGFIENGEAYFYNIPYIRMVKVL